MHGVERTIIAYESLILSLSEVTSYGVLNKFFQVDIDSGADIEATIEERVYAQLVFQLGDDPSDEMRGADMMYIGSEGHPGGQIFCLLCHRRCNGTQTRYLHPLCEHLIQHKLLAI